MTLPAEWAQHAAAFLLVWARVGPFLMTLPATGDDGVPGRVRLLFSLGLSGALFGLLEDRTAALAQAGHVTQAFAMLAEVGIGLALGMVVRTVLHAATIAGSLISLQIGLTSALVFDPALGGQTPLLGKLVALAATLMCFSLGIHHLWIEALIGSYSSFPVGSTPNAGDMLELALRGTLEAMRLGVALSAPLLLYGILFNVALGLATRLAPAIQLFFIAQPLNLALGFALVGIIAQALLTGFTDAYAGWLLEGWSGV